MEKCVICFQNIYTGVSLSHYFAYDDVICGKCRAQMIPIGKWKKIKGMNIFVLYEYNDFMESLLFQFKEGRDIALQSLFFYRWNSTITDKFKGWTIAYMPSGAQKEKERGFFPLEKMVEKIALPKVNIFEKTAAYKQSQMNYKQRVGIHKVMKRKKEISFKGTKLLFLDDVITSGETLKCAFHLMKNRAQECAALVLCDNYQGVDNCD